MTKFSAYLGLCVFAAFNTNTNTNANANAKTTPESSEPETLRWQQKDNRSDSFNGKVLNKAIWQNAPKSLNVGAWTFDKNNAFVKDGYLNIMATQETHTRTFQDSCWDGVAGGTPKAVQRELFYKSGAVRTIAEGVYGYYEARIKGVDVFPGLSPAFWLYSDGHPYNDRKDKNSQYVDYSEIDIVELQQADWRSPTDIDGISDMDHNLHARVEENGQIVWKRPKPNPKDQLLHYKAPFDPSKDFHTYAVENRKDKISWYVDGKLVGSKLNKWWHRPMHMIFSMGLRRHLVNFNSACQRADPNAEHVVSDGFPERSTMQIDYVKVWEVLPSVWINKTQKLARSHYSTSDKVVLSVNYHGGSNHFVDTNKLKGVTLQLIEKSTDDKFVRTIKSVTDISTTTEAKRYGGIAEFTINLTDVLPTVLLPKGHYYSLIPSFYSSIGQDVYPVNSLFAITITR